MALDQTGVLKDTLRQYLQQWTQLDEAQMTQIIEQIPVQEFPKGTVILAQGDMPQHCYFVLSGCVRQYGLSSEGKETTVNYFTEHQAVTIYTDHKSDKSSDYTLVCLEDCTLVVGELTEEQEMYAAYPELATMTRMMMTQNFGAVQDDFARFMASTPEERYSQLLKKRPGLIDRVPQHQLASYLGITPESLSRIKRRLSQE